MAIDITNTIIEFLIAELPPIMNAGLDTTDPPYLKTLVRAPLQDDPTRRAFYLCVEADVERGFRKPIAALRRGDLGVEMPTPAYEIGGGFRMVNFFRLFGWTPRRSNAQVNEQLGGEAVRRMERALAIVQRRDLIAGIETDDGMESTFGMQQVFANDDRGYEVIGGESERYCKVWARFEVFSEVANAYWS